MRREPRRTGLESQNRAVALVGRFWRRCASNIATLVALIVLVLLFFAVIGASKIARHDPIEQNLGNAFARPNRVNWLGTDRYGQDIFSRIVHGSRLTVSVGFFSVALGLVVGTTIGLVAGYRGGVSDELLMRAIDVLLAFPGILLAILVVAVLGSSLVNVIIALAIFSIPIFARITRGSVLAVKDLEYVHAAHSIGSPFHRILLMHILPNIWGPLIVYSTLRIATAMLGAATLSFLGIGLAPPAPEWGLMISDGRNYMQSSPHVVFFPGFALFLTVLSFNLIGDALRDVADPKSAA